MSVQSFKDLDEDGFLEVALEYRLWGNRWQSALLNSRVVKALYELELDDHAIQLSNWLVNVMWSEENDHFYQLFDLDESRPIIGHENDFAFSDACAADALLTTFEKTNNSIYLDYATRSLDWIIHTQAVKEAGGIYFTHPDVWGSHRVVSALASAYNLTGNPRYLQYALAGAEWIIGEMAEPFLDFGDNNPWTVAEALEAIQEVYNIIGFYPASEDGVNGVNKHGVNRVMEPQGTLGEQALRDEGLKSIGMVMIVTSTVFAMIKHR